MRVEEILLLIAEYPYVYIFALLLNCISAAYLVNRYVKNYLDPLFIALIGVVFANTILLFLFFTKDQEWFTVSSFLGLEFLFWFGFCSNRFRHIKRFRVVEHKNDSQFFNFCFILIVCFQLLYFIEQGLPIFKESRIDRYNGATSGLGIFERLTYVMQMYCALYSFLHISDKYKKKSLIYLVYLTIISILNGGKSALISIVTPAFFYISYFTTVSISKKSYGIIGSIVLFFAIFVVFISTGSWQEGFFTVIRRFMMYGDTYYESLGNGTISIVKIQHPFNDLFVNILAPFRLMDYNTNVDLAPSLQIHRYVYPESENILSGPNNRLPFLYYCLYGFIPALFLSYFTGRFVSWGMYKSYRKNIDNLVGFSKYAVLYVTLLQFPTDPILCLGSLASWIIGSIFISVMYSLIGFRRNF